MSFFTSDTDVKYYAPKTAKGTSGTQGRNYMSSLLGKGIDFPRREIAGMSDIEKRGQDILSNIASGSTFQDPRTSPLWSGLRREMKADEQEGADALSHRFRNLTSSPAFNQMGDYRANMANKRAVTLGGLYERERDRDNPYTRLAAIDQFGGLPRTIEQSKSDAGYNQKIQNLLASFQYLLPLAQQIVGNETWYGPTVTSSPSMFSEIAGPVAGLMQGFGDLAGGFGFGSKDAAAAKKKKGP